jgi:predicted DNA-binding transcriptional regulator YafY
LLLAAVRALRAGDRAATALLRRNATPPGEGASGLALRRPVADVLATLQEAAATGEALLVGYVNAEGHASERIVEPISVQGGYVSAYDHLRDEVRTFSVHRITGVATLDD